MKLEHNDRNGIELLVSFCLRDAKPVPVIEEDKFGLD